VSREKSLGRRSESYSVKKLRKRCGARSHREARAGNFEMNALSRSPVFLWPSGGSCLYHGFLVCKIKSHERFADNFMDVERA
jgi:hypothetical protein